MHNNITGMFVATLCRTSTFLGGRHEVVIDGVSDQTVCHDAHKQFVNTAHKGNGTEVGHVSCWAFFMNEDCSRGFPLGRDIVLKEAAVEYVAENFPFGINVLKVSVLNSISSGGRVGQRAQLLGDFFGCNWISKRLIFGTRRDELV